MTLLELSRTEQNVKVWEQRFPFQDENVDEKGKGKKGSDYRNRWEIPLPNKRNTKRKIQKGSTDVCLLKRAIEIEID